MCKNEVISFFGVYRLKNHQLFFYFLLVHCGNPAIYWILIPRMLPNTAGHFFSLFHDMINGTSERFLSNELTHKPWIEKWDLIFYYDSICRKLCCVRFLCTLHFFQHSNWFFFRVFFPLSFKLNSMLCTLYLCLCTFFAALNLFGAEDSIFGNI